MFRVFVQLVFPIIIMLIITLLLSIWTVKSAVLDTALYLVPSPPLAQTGDSLPPAEVWGRSLEETAEIIPREVMEHVDFAEATSEKSVAVSSRMFWPRFSSPQPVLGVHIPLTFSLSGAYGKVPSLSGGVIGNTYTNVAGIGSSVSSLFGKTAVASSYGNFGRSALAGSSYGTYGTSAVRVYGGDNVAAWSGWGNGKWGHYGKG